MEQQQRIIINARGEERVVSMAYRSPLTARKSLAYSLGRGFDGDRDYYQALGYTLEPVAEDFWARYLRDDIAGRVVDLPAQDTWKKRPVLVDGDSRSDEAEPDSEFLRAWQQMTDSDSQEALNVYSYFERVDRLCGIGRFGVLLIGLRDGQPLDTEATGPVQGPEGVLFLSAFSEGSVLVNPSDMDLDPASRRFGRVAKYQINLGGDLGGGGYETVHWSRALHVAEDLLEDEVYGRPRLERIFNRLDDLMKIVGGSAEATWKLMRKGLAIVAKDGYMMPQDTTTKNDFLTQIEEYDHGLRRVLRLGGVDLTELGSEVVDPSGLFGIILSLIAAASNIPQKVLIGAGWAGLGGDAAGAQDLLIWGNSIQNRQANFAEPMILRAFVNRCISWGALPAPASGQYTVEWPPLYTLTELEQAEKAEKYARAIEAYVRATGAVDVVPPDEFRETYLGLPPGEGLLEPAETEEERAIFEEMRTLRGVNGRVIQAT